MASYHVSIKVGRKNVLKGGTACAHYAYVGRSGKYSKLRKDEELVHVESGNLPSWARKDASIFWLASDTYERTNGTVYREFQAAIPREISWERPHEIVQAFISRVLGQEHPYTFAIHTKNASDELPQPHVHLMWSERALDGIERDPAHFFKRAAAGRRGKNGIVQSIPDASTGGCKKISMHHRLLEFRELWEELVNNAYARARLPHRVSHRTLSSQGIDRKAEHYLGPIGMRGVDGTILMERRKARIKADAAETEALAVMSRNDTMRPSFEVGQELKAALDALWRAPRLNHESIAPMPPARFAALEKFENSIENHSGRRSSKLRAFSPEILRSRTKDMPTLTRLPSVAFDTSTLGWKVVTNTRRRDVVYEQETTGGHLIDKGSLIILRQGCPAEIEAVIEIAKLGNWPNIAFSGNDDFEISATAAALCAGLKLHESGSHARLSNNHDDTDEEGGLGRRNGIRGDREQTNKTATGALSPTQQAVPKR